MNNKNHIIPIVISLIALILTLNLKFPQYQIANCNAESAILIDQHTGEAWVTDTYEQDSTFSGTEKITYLKPVGYCGFQKDSYTYKPNEKRNDKNTTWLIWLNRKWNSFINLF